MIVIYVSRAVDFLVSTTMGTEYYLHLITLYYSLKRDAGESQRFIF